jgi:hypothetical protein
MQMSLRTSARLRSPWMTLKSSGNSSMRVKYRNRPTRVRLGQFPAVLGSCGIVRNLRIGLLLPPFPPNGQTRERIGPELSSLIANEMMAIKGNVRTIRKPTRTISTGRFIVPQKNATAAVDESGDNGHEAALFHKQQRKFFATGLRFRSINEPQVYTLQANLA